MHLTNDRLREPQGDRQAKRKRLTSFSGDSYNLEFVSSMICGTVPGTGIRKTIYSKE
jgi:hypothetical protein